ncbi:putative dehydrogenase [Actinoplanes lutulentus]|uniref:Putative dehydrogenase n=1 Tax=Actinoplanes lutulentus TaxID=1287878 RepID=A0A327ZKH6_9ACTN|nr:Gfo/Idh/MocA family oxidoreductase [Actinoplanes lutulentus]MBB2945808.1 putative dehydrogenase [Actinoplanes lutulentus]RAK37857.1 putative dehydrogenase [Actinoplanes lutulentus]
MNGQKVRWGILGPGGIASTFAADLPLVEGAELAAVGSRSLATAEAFAQRHGFARAHGSYADLAADDGVDIVYVATPHAFHFEGAMLCVEAGKAVLVEKPITLDLASTAQLIQAARAKGVFLMEAMWMRCNPAIRKIAELVEEGAIGWVSAIHADFGLQGPFDASHRLRDPELGGGALLDLGVYPIHLTHMLLGSPAKAHAWAHLTPERVDENTGVLLGYEAGAVAALTCSINGESRNAASITGTDGRIDLPPGFFIPRSFVLNRPGKAPETFEFPFEGSGYQFEAAEAQRCFLAGEAESPLVSHEATLEVMALLDALREEIGVYY